MKIRIDAGGLDAAVPDIAKEIARDGRSRQEQEPHSSADEENAQKRAAARSVLRAAADDKPARGGVRRTLQQHNHADFGIVEVCNHQGAGGRKDQQAACKRQKRPIEPCDPFHSAALPNSFRARRFLKS
jgi:hypothetical protein